MTYTIHECQTSLIPVPVSDELNDLSTGLQLLAKKYELDYLLAHADDGVIWGRISSEGELYTSHDVAPNYSPPLHVDTIQQIRLFSTQAQLLLWRDGEKRWQARLLSDTLETSNPQFCHHYDELQMLWGTSASKLDLGFTLLTEGIQGMQHAVPLTLPATLDVRMQLRLRVRHYLATDAFARVVVSRLVGFELGLSQKVGE